MAGRTTAARPAFNEGHTARSIGNRANGARFGRIMMAMPAAAPEAMVAGPRPVASASDAVQNAAAGTSLIADIDMKSIVGLAAIASAAMVPGASPARRTPSTYVNQTRIAAHSGPT
jgi:hypothetical protein